MKLWELWVRYIEYINELLNEKRWLKLSGHILIILFCTASVGTFLSGIVYLFIINWEEIATVVGTHCDYLYNWPIPKEKSCSYFARSNTNWLRPRFSEQHLQFVEDEHGFHTCGDRRYASSAYPFYSQPD